MKHINLLFLFLFLSLHSIAQSGGPDLMWVKSIQSAADSPEDLGFQVVDVAVSPGGNVYLAGFCTAPCAFAQGVAVIPEAGGISYFIAKYRGDGLFEWVKDLGTIGESPFHIVAPSLDGVYLATSFSVNSVDLGDGITVTKTCTGTFCNEVLLAKFGPGGETLWAKTYKGDTGSNFQVAGIEKSGAGDMVALISYDSEILNLGPGFMYSNQQELSFFLSFFNTNAGTTTDVKFPVNSTGSPTGKSMAFNQNGQGVMIGTFDDQITFSNGTTLTTTEPSGTHFAAGLDASGVVQWARKISSSEYVDVLGVDMDTEGGAYLAIDASTDLKLDDANILSISSSYAGAVLKLKGSNFAIPVFIPYDSDDYAIMDVALHPWGFIYTVGYISEAITFGNNQVEPDGCVDALITATSYDGFPVSARTVGGGGCELFSNEYYGSCIDFDDNGCLYGAGGFLYNFNEDGFVFNGKGGFVTKFNTGISSLTELDWGSLDIFPNPSTGNFTINLSEFPTAEAVISITNTHGQEVYRQAATHQETQLKTTLSPGMYLVTVIDGNRIYRGKILVL
jgi:hypothetical protein